MSTPTALEYGALGRSEARAIILVGFAIALYSLVMLVYEGTFSPVQAAVLCGVGVVFVFVATLVRFGAYTPLLLSLFYLLGYPLWLTNILGNWDDYRLSAYAG